MAIALGLVYLHYYKSNDTWLFFYDAVKAAELGRTDIGEYIQFLWNSESSNPIMISLVNTQERSLFLVKIISITCLLTADNYWLCSIYFASISFFASWFLFASVSRHFDNSYREAALAFLFIPPFYFGVQVWLRKHWPWQEFISLLLFSLKWLGQIEFRF